MEALQVLKFNRRNGVLDFASGIVDNPTELEMVDLDEMSDNDVERSSGGLEHRTIPYTQN
jgi:hypothetical protein